MERAAPGWRGITARLAACQALLLATNTTLITVCGLVGQQIAPEPRWATLPTTTFILGAALTAFPASFHMQRAGRRAGLLLGTLLSVVGGLVSAVAVNLGAFAGLCLGSAVMGAGSAYGQFYRFAAMDGAEGAERATAVSRVLLGGLVGGVAGPLLARASVDALEVRYLGSFVLMTCYPLVAMALLAFTRLAPAEPAVAGQAGPPVVTVLGVLVRRPVFVVAVGSSALGYGVMNLLMTSTPLAMGACGHAFDATAVVIASHVAGMYAPGFFTGRLVARAGVLRVMALGALLEGVAAGVALGGVELARFWWALVILGVGWNFLFIGATTLLASAHDVKDKAVAQGTNELVVYATMGCTSLAAGALVTGPGWDAVNRAAMPAVGLVLAGLAWLALRRTPDPAAST